MTERAQALEAIGVLVKMLIWNTPEREDFCPPISAFPTPGELLALDAIADILRALAVSPPPPVGSPTTEDVQTMREHLGVLFNAMWRGEYGQQGQRFAADHQVGPVLKWLDTMWPPPRGVAKSTPVEPAEASEPPSGTNLLGDHLCWACDRACDCCQPDECVSCSLCGKTKPQRAQHVATCETNGHVYGHTGACLFCGEPKSTPVEPAGASEPPSEMDSGIVLLVSAASAASGYLERQQPDLAARLWNAVQLVLKSQPTPVSPVVPEPPTNAWWCCKADYPDHEPTCMWREFNGGFSAESTCIDKETGRPHVEGARDVSRWAGCPYCLKPLTVER